MILNGLHARPALVRALPWYKQRALRRLVKRAQRRARVQTSPPSTPASPGEKPVATVPVAGGESI